ncbi:uncharacterized protein Tco025E_06487 [Trypanosoma conorhini]|uniref:Amastin n=1 Tax=Trypanosoma conorhini TaxID=83891 RepID=A0A3R7RSW7_9TRYP|nr:uncharacterized protein Tco025E_06487 [Trypanosoma conorhini]RNF12218.1 hypothetical protein Tco025E_06487 [Trypanosoma conorhini]
MMFPSTITINRKGGSADLAAALVAAIVVFLFVLSGTAETPLYTLKTMEGSKYRLSLWSGEICTVKGGCLTQKLPPTEWCRQRRVAFTALQTLSIVALVGSLALVVSLLLELLAAKVYRVDLLFFASAVATWLLLLVEWAMMVGVFHGPVCANPSFNELNYQLGASFALFLMAWVFLSVLLVYGHWASVCG